MADTVTQCPNPLRPEDCQTLNHVLASCAQTRELIAKCKACGFPIEDQEERNNNQHMVAEAIKQQFFPRNP